MRTTGLANLQCVRLKGYVMDKAKKGLNHVVELIELELNAFS